MRKNPSPSLSRSAERSPERSTELTPKAHAEGSRLKPSLSLEGEE